MSRRRPDPPILEPPQRLLPAPRRGIVGHVTQSTAYAVAHERVVDGRLEIVVAVDVVSAAAAADGRAVIAPEGPEVERPPARDLVHARLVVDQVAPVFAVAAAAAADRGVIISATFAGPSAATAGREIPTDIIPLLLGGANFVQPPREIPPVVAIGRG